MDLYRSSTLQHKLGGAISTPLLVPSFSSKGLGFMKPDAQYGFSKKHVEQISDANLIMATAKAALTQTALVSAFDISQDFIPQPKNLLLNVDLMFVDSGGYETSNYYDLSELFEGPIYKQDWTPEEHLKVLNKWPDHIPSVFISFDQNIEFAKQIEAAQKLSAKFPSQLSSFLIKPEHKTHRVIPIKSILPLIEELKHFDIIGITEKELGYSILNRMTNLAEFRLALDKAGITAPIHVFGSLDPITTCLYFFAGAEIFDGLTWSRMSYSEGLATYKANHGAIKYGIHVSDDQVKVRTLYDNIYYLISLQENMHEFAKNGDFSVFKDHGKFFMESFESLKAKLK